MGADKLFVLSCWSGLLLLSWVLGSCVAGCGIVPGTIGCLASLESMN